VPVASVDWADVPLAAGLLVPLAAAELELELQPVTAAVASAASPTP
jgi:hypothetical protein